MLYSFSLVIPSDAQVYPNVTSGLPIKVVLLSLSHLSISLCAISCCLAQLDVRDSDSSFPVPALELGKCPGGVQWCSATKIWFLELLLLKNVIIFVFIFSGDSNKISFLKKISWLKVDVLSYNLMWCSFFFSIFKLLIFVILILSFHINWHSSIFHSIGGMSPLPQPEQTVRVLQVTWYSPSCLCCSGSPTIVRMVWTFLKTTKRFSKTQFLKKYFNLNVTVLWR